MDAEETLPIVDPRSRRVELLIGVVLFLATLAVFAPSVRYDFVAFDDYKYVVSNHDIISGLGSGTVGRAFTSLFYTNYSPLLILCELMISTLFGPGPAGFHGTNVVLHSINAVLLYQFFRLTGGKLSIAAAAAAFWALHPLRVESVAWVSELKDELCGLFWLLTMLAYVRYVRQPSWIRYLLVLILCTAALASKPMAVTLSFVLMLLDVYPLQRFRFSAIHSPRKYRNLFLVAEKLPLIFLSILWSYLTTRDSTKRLNIPPLARFENAVVSIGCYLRDTVAPRGLAVFYPHPILVGDRISLLHVGVAGAAIVVISIFTIYAARRGQAALMIGWLFFLGTLVPVLGFTQGNEAARADRYTYIPTIGILAAVVWTLSSTASTVSHLRARRAFAATAAVVVLSILAIESRATEAQLRTWRNTDTLFTHALAVTDSNYLACSELANVRRSEHRPAEALQLAEQSLAMKPNNRDALASKALTLIELNRNAEALDTLRIAIHVDPANAVFFREAGNVLAALKKRTQAEKMYQQSIRLVGNDAITHSDYGDLLASEGKLADAVKQWMTAVTIAPNIPYPHLNLAQEATLHGDVRTAIYQYRQAVRLSQVGVKPEWRLRLAWLEATAPDATAEEADDAVAQAALALVGERSPSPLALDTYAAALARAGQFDRAISLASRAAKESSAAGNTVLSAAITRRLENYKHSKPFIAEPSSAVVSESSPVTK